MEFLIFLNLFITLSVASISFDGELNSQCSSTFTGDNGICVEAKDCAAFKTSRNELKICSFNKRIPIVCCPRQFSFRDGQKRISEQKCEEYTARSDALGVQRPHSIFARSLPDDTNEAFYRPTIVGGTIVIENEFPHMSAIGWRLDDGEISWRCGGSLISEKFVLSAAHCIFSIGGKPNVIRLGDNDLKGGSDGQEFEIKNIIAHPSYKRSLKYHDIALFELDGVARFDKSVLPACLHQINDDLSQYLPTAMGWGQTSYGGQTSSKLLKGYLNIVNNTECNKSYLEEQEIPDGITNDQVCAWDPRGEQDTCQGDSGGPLGINRTPKGSTKSIYEIIGITSFGKFCAAGIPGVYVKVFPYLDWIESIVWP